MLLLLRSGFTAPFRKDMKRMAGCQVVTLSALPLGIRVFKAKCITSQLPHPDTCITQMIMYTQTQTNVESSDP